MTTTIHLCPKCGTRVSSPELYEGWHPLCAPDVVARRVVARLAAELAGRVAELPARPQLGHGRGRRAAA